MTSKTPAQLQREVDDHLREMRAIEAEASAGSMTAVNSGSTYQRLSASPSSRKTHRWVGRCARCGETHKIEGRMLSGHRHGASGSADYVIRARDGRLLTTAAMGTDVSLIWVPCGDHRCLLRRVTEGTKKSKHQCGARCTSATGPNCDCKCRGENHGSNL